jgi:hypothetical protein
MIDLRLKKRFVEHCILLQKESMESVENQIRLVESAANNYGPNKDRYDGFRNQQVRQGNMLARQFGQLQENIEALQLVRLDRIHPDADFGALVEIDNSVIFICVGLGIVSFEDRKFVVISKSAPIFSALKGKKPGDFVFFNGIKRNINQIV